MNVDKSMIYATAYIQGCVIRVHVGVGKDKNKRLGNRFGWIMVKEWGYYSNGSKYPKNTYFRYDPTPEAAPPVKETK